MAWLFLLVAGLCEIAWAIGLKYTEGFSRLLPTIGTVAAMVASIGFLGIALKSLPVDPQAGEILMPGERGRRTFESRSRDGIPIPRAVYDELQALANRLGVAMFPSSR